MINDFHVDKYRFLSNFYPAEVEWNGIKYPTVEHAYQAAKTLNPKEVELIRTATTPGKAKQLGKVVTKIPGFDILKIDVMRVLLYQKFDIPELKQKLLDTGDENLVEGNNWKDTFWGVYNGYGENHLGRLLMEVRAKLKND